MIYTCTVFFSPSCLQCNDNGFPCILWFFDFFCISKSGERDHFWRCGRRWFRIGCDLCFWRKPRDGNHQRSGARSRCDNAARHLNWPRNWETIWDRILGLLYWRSIAGRMGICGSSWLFACSSTKQVHCDRLWTLARSSTRRCLISRSATFNCPRVSSAWRQALSDSLLAHCRRPWEGTSEKDGSNVWKI